MVANTIFFWILPVMYALFTGVFMMLARSEQGTGCARKGASAFAVAIVAVILDTQRSYFPHWFFTLAVPMHWLVIVYTAEAFLARHNDQLPRKPVAAVFAIGMAINFGATFIVDSAAIRVPNASIACIILIALAVPRFFRSNMNVMDRLIAATMVATLLVYVVRFGVYFLFDQQQEYVAQSMWSQYMLLSYFTSAIITLAMAILLMVVISSDIISRHHAATTMDPLTGIANRRGFDALVQQQGVTMPAIGAVMMIDLDHFKRVNDQHGHAVGDKVLVEAAATLEQGCATFGRVARVGGEEFAVLVYRTHAAATKHLAELLRTAISLTPMGEASAPIQVTASIGLAMVEIDEAISDTLRRADMALYQAKTEGRNRVEWANPLADMRAKRASG